jgi:hypothetical protein
MVQLRPASIAELSSVQQLLSNPATFADQQGSGGLPLAIQKMLFITCAQFALERTQSMDSAPSATHTTCASEAAARLEHVIKSQLDGFVQVGATYNAALVSGNLSLASPACVFK